MLNITKEQAERIAWAWIRDQERTLDTFGGYPGELFVVRDMLVWFVNSAGSKYDGPQVSVLTAEQAVSLADDTVKEAAENAYDEYDKVFDPEYEAFFGESVPTLAEYLMTAEGGPDSYSAGNPYKPGAPAVKRFEEVAQRIAQCE